MVLKFGKTGQFLGCSKYPECKATRPLGGQPRAEAVESEHACPKCGKPLLIRENKRGEKFLSCSGYPECKESFNIDEQGNPVPSRVETEHVCEKCGKPMALRQGRRGPFLGCTGYPKCRNVLAVDAEGKPVQTVKIDVKCEKCGKPMAVRQGRRGAFLGCTGYPKCRGTAQVPEELKEQLAELARRPAAAAGARPEDHRGRRDLRRLRQPHGRPPRPSRLLPGLLQVPQVQGHQGAERRHHGEDHRGHGKLKICEGRAGRGSAGRRCPTAQLACGAANGRSASRKPSTSGTCVGVPGQRRWTIAASSAGSAALADRNGIVLKDHQELPLHFGRES